MKYLFTILFTICGITMFSQYYPDTIYQNHIDQNIEYVEDSKKIIDDLRIVGFAFIGVGIFLNKQNSKNKSESFVILGGSILAVSIPVDIFLERSRRKKFTYDHFY